MTMNVIVTVSLSVRPEKVETLLGMVPAMQKETLTRPGVRSVRALHNPGEPTKLLFLDEFESLTASNAYFKWRQERGDLDRLGALLSEPPRVEVWPSSIAPA